jgi:hypothetical protein
MFSYGMFSHGSHPFGNPDTRFNRSRTAFVHDLNQKRRRWRSRTTRNKLATLTS